MPTYTKVLRAACTPTNINPAYTPLKIFVFQTIQPKAEQALEVAPTVGFTVDQVKKG